MNKVIGEKKNYLEVSYFKIKKIAIVIALFYPLIMYLILIWYKLTFIPFSDNHPFVDYWIFKKAFSYFPNNIYEYKWFIYTPSFFIIFFYINFFTFESGLIIWWILSISLLIACWYHILKNNKYSNVEKITFFILILNYAIINEVFSGNSDFILMACGIFSLFILEKTGRSRDEKYVILGNIIASLILALGMFKPALIIFFPLLILKSSRKIILFFFFGLFLLILNIQFLFQEGLFLEFIESNSSGTLVGTTTYYNDDFLNLIWRSSISGPRH